MKNSIVLIAIFFVINTIFSQPALALRDSLNLTEALLSSKSVDYLNPVKISTLKNVKYYELQKKTPPFIICWDNYVPQLRKIFEVTFCLSDDTNWEYFRVKNSTFDLAPGYLIAADVDSTGIVYKANIISLINKVDGKEYYFVKSREKLYDYPSHSILKDGTKVFEGCIDVNEDRYRLVTRVFY